MTKHQEDLISVVVPLFNEAEHLRSFHESLIEELKKIHEDHQIIYVDDGSSDGTDVIVKEFCDDNHKIKLIKLSRNFGKENALAAGIAQANGAAVIMIDGDGQHPVELIPKFINAWHEGAKVVIGVRKKGDKPGTLKQIGSYIFYSLFNKITDEQIIPRSTDFRLIDNEVQREFLNLKESDRFTRGLIDWLGFKRQLIYFEANDRQYGEPGYSLNKLIKLAAHSFVSFTPLPLYAFGYLGILITFGAFILGISVLMEQVMLGDPLGWNFTGTAMLSILTLFLVGILLMAQGVLSLYVTHIHSQTKNRPLYIIDQEGSIGAREA